MSITEFLNARIAEDEAAAREYQQYEDEVYETAGWFNCTRVLAECAAKRAIVELANKATHAEKECDDYEWQGTVESGPYIGDSILYALAAVYADHPAYRDEWRVGA